MGGLLCRCYSSSLQLWALATSQASRRLARICTRVASIRDSSDLVETLDKQLFVLRSSDLQQTWFAPGFPDDVC